MLVMLITSKKTIRDPLNDLADKTQVVIGSVVKSLLTKSTHLALTAQAMLI